MSSTNFGVSWHRGLAYRAFVHPVAEYGGILLMGASATQLSKLDHMQHFAEQLCPYPQQ